MTLKSNRPPSRRTAQTEQKQMALVPRPFRRRPWLLAASAAALALWLAFLSLMAWQQWQQEKKRPSPLREKETAGEAAGKQ